MYTQGYKDIYIIYIYIYKMYTQGYKPDWLIVNNTATTLYVTYGNWTNFDDHFIMYENINSLYFTPETNILS